MGKALKDIKMEQGIFVLYNIAALSKSSRRG